MYFSLLFDSEEPPRTYDLLYIPSPVWMKDEKEVLNLGFGGYYELGGIEKLLQKEEEYFNNILRPDIVEIIIHEDGHGEAKCLALLILDLIENDLIPIIQFGQSGN